MLCTSIIQSIMLFLPLQQQYVMIYCYTEIYWYVIVRHSMSQHVIVYTSMYDLVYTST